MPPAASGQSQPGGSQKGPLAKGGPVSAGQPQASGSNLNPVALARAIARKKQMAGAVPQANITKPQTGPEEDIDELMEEAGQDLDLTSNSPQVQKARSVAERQNQNNDTRAGLLDQNLPEESQGALQSAKMNAPGQNTKGKNQQVLQANLSKDQKSALGTAKQSVPGNPGGSGLGKSQYLQSKISPSAQAALNKAKTNLPKSPSSPGSGGSVGKDAAAGAAKKMLGKAAAEGVKELGVGIDPNQLADLTQKMKSGDIGGAAKAGAQTAAFMGLEWLWDASFGAIAPSFGLSILGMEAAVLAGKFVGVRLVWWKRWLVHAFNMLVIAIIFLIIIITVAVLSLACQKLGASGVLFILRLGAPGLAVVEYFSGVSGLQFLEPMCSTLNGWSKGGG